MGPFGSFCGLPPGPAGCALPGESVGRQVSDTLKEGFPTPKPSPRGEGAPVRTLGRMRGRSRTQPFLVEVEKGGYRLSPQRGFSIAPLGKSIAPSSVTFGDSFPPRGSRRKLWAPQGIPFPHCAGSRHEKRVIRFSCWFPQKIGPCDGQYPGKQLENSEKPLGLSTAEHAVLALGGKHLGPDPALSRLRGNVAHRQPQSRDGPRRCKNPPHTAPTAFAVGP